MNHGYINKKHILEKAVEMIVETAVAEKEEWNNDN